MARRRRGGGKRKGGRRRRQRGSKRSRSGRSDASLLSLRYPYGVGGI